MINMQDVEQVRALQANMRATLDTPAGKEVVNYLEDVCGWYDFSHVDPVLIQIQNGKRQILATIKTLLKFSAEEVVTIVTEKEI